MRRSLLDYFFENASNETDAAFSGRIKLRRRSWKYAAIARRSFQFARELRSRNIGRGDRIMILADNSPEWIIVFWGSLLRGVILVPLDEQSSPDLVDRVIIQTEPKLLVTDRRTDLSPATVQSLFVEDLADTIAYHSDQPIEPVSISGSDLVEIVFTSGTTGEPKGVELTHENILANLEPIESVINRYIKWEFMVHPIRIMNTLPLSHVFGQILSIFMPTLIRAEMVFQNHLSPNEVAEAVRRDRIAVLACVPRVLANLRRKIERELPLTVGRGVYRLGWPARWWKHRDVHRIFGYKFMGFVTGGATLDQATEEFWNSLGFAVIQGYGMTETAALISLNNPFSVRRGSLGEIIAGNEVKIADDGEILVRGKNISQGYWGDGKRAGEWLHTGDIGSMDDTGRLYFKSRKKDVIVTAAGLNIYADDLEAVLDGQNGIVDSAVVGIDGPDGPEPVAALLIRTGTDVDSALSKANRSLAPFQRIRRWVVWPEPDFPRTPTQKIRKTEIAEYILKRARPDESGASHSIISNLIARFGGGNNSVSSSKLSEDLNLDSLARVELLSALEDRYQIDLDERAFTEKATVGDIEKMIRSDAKPDDELVRFSYPLLALRRLALWVRSIFYYAVVYPITRLLSRAKVEGIENLKGLDGPVLFASNHITRGDPALIMSVLPRHFRSRMAIAMDGEMLEGFRHPPADASFYAKAISHLKYWSAILFFNVFPLPRLSGFRRSFAFAGEAMDRGFSVLIFPEGELTKDGRTADFRSGVGILADGLEAPIIPVRIEGLWELKEQGRRYYAPPGSVAIRFSEPLYFERDESPSDFAKRLQGIIAK